MTDDLKELALAATPGPWTGFVDKGRLVAIMPSGRPGDICTFADPPSDADAAFMLAATPDAILDLIRERDEARERETCAKLEHAAAEAALSAARKEVERLSLTVGHRDRRIARLVSALSDAREQGFRVPADDEPKLTASTTLTKEPTDV